MTTVYTVTNSSTATLPERFHTESKQYKPKTLIFDSGSPTLTAAVAREMAASGAEIIVASDISIDLATLADEVTSLGGRLRTKTLGTSPEVSTQAAEILEGLDVVVNLYVPAPNSDPAEVFGYPARLLHRSLAAARVLVSHTPRGSIVSQCFLPAIYAGTQLEDIIPAVKGAITGVTRTVCRRFAHKGLRSNYVQTGLIDLPELTPHLSALVRGLAVPAGRWGTAEDVAALIEFLANEDHYMTGQVVLLDGGLTAGLTGT